MDVGGLNIRNDSRPCAYLKDPKGEAYYASG